MQIPLTIPPKTEIAERGSSVVLTRNRWHARNQPRRLGLFLLLIIVCSFALRLAAWAYYGTGTIESEGAEYARIAENLRNGVGYVGLVSTGPQVLFNPLFPLLIAGGSFFTHDYELAGRLIALVLGALLPLPVFGIASRMFNRRVGLIAAGLTLVHPLLVYLSFMVYSEGPYATLFLSAVYLAIRALDRPSAKSWLLVGGAFGVCYLFRAEAFGAFLLTAVFSCCAMQWRAKRCKQIGYAMAVFLALALPEVVFIYKSTGKVLLEGKTTILFAYTGRRILAAETRPGMDYMSGRGVVEMPSSGPDEEGGYPSRWEGKWAFYGIDSEANGTGTATRPFAEIVRDTSPRIRDAFPLIAKGLRQNVPGLLENLSSGWLGAPLLPALALLGAFRRPWLGPPASIRLYVLLVTAVPVVATLFVLWGDARYYFIFVPLLCLWAANGLFELGLWVKASAKGAGWSALARSAAAVWLVPGLLVITMMYTPMKQVRTQYEFSDSAPPTRVDKELGLWIGKQQNRPIRIMDLSLPLSYHAGAVQHVYFPYCSEDLALRYLDRARVDYVVLRRGKKFTKYYGDWLTRGISDGRAELVHLPSSIGASNFIVYRWRGINNTAASADTEMKRE